MNLRHRLSIKDIAICALLTAILFVQEELLTFIPGLQFTVFLIILYSKKVGWLRTTLIVIIHTILDNVVMGSLNIVYTPFMLMGWLFIPAIVCTLLKSVENNVVLSIFAAIFSIVYCWIFFIPNVFIVKIDFIAYLLSDLPWEGTMAAVSMLETVILYPPVAKVFDKFCPITKQRAEESKQ